MCVRGKDDVIELPYQLHFFVGGFSSGFAVCQRLEGLLIAGGRDRREGRRDQGREGGREGEWRREIGREGGKILIGMSPWKPSMC